MNRLSIFCLAIILFAACRQKEPSLQITRMQGYPNDVHGLECGVSAPFVGSIHDNLIMAGGCNFPDVPAAKGGEKIFYSGIYAASIKTDSVLQWKRVGTLPQPLAYGVAITDTERIILIGGNNSKQSSSYVYSLSMRTKQCVIDSLPSLPVTIDNMAAALCNGSIYVVGGNVNGKPSRNVYRLSLNQLKNGWKLIGEMPGNNRVQPVCTAVGNNLYIWGGYNPASNGAPATISLTGLKYATDKKEWKELPAPRDIYGEEVFTGGAAIANSKREIIITGGVNKHIFLNALNGEYANINYLSMPVSWYCFNDNLLRYNIVEEKWDEPIVCSSTARAGAVLTRCSDVYFQVMGELKPGIRTTDIYKFTIN